jgi:hypothetical protein
MHKAKLALSANKLSPRVVGLAHKRLSLDFVCFLIALLGAQRVGQQPTGQHLRGMITAGEAEGLAAAVFRLARIAFGEPQISALYPQQRIIRLDAQCAIERRGGAVQIAVGPQRLCLRYQSASGGR